MAKYLNSIVEIAKGADEIILDIYEKYKRDSINIKYKNDNSPLTEADTKASDFICSKLKNLDPTIPIICEETKQVPYEERKNWSRFWLVDPLDGTKEFIKKNGEFTVNICLIENNQPTLGVVSVPVQGKVYYSYRGSGAYMYDKGGNSRVKLECNLLNKDNPVNVVCSRSHGNKSTSNYLNNYKIGELIVSGSSLKFMLLCENKAQLYPRLHPTMEWDIAASDAILREAGGSIRLLDGNLMQYNKQDLRNPSFIAFGNIND